MALVEKTRVMVTEFFYEHMLEGKAMITLSTLRVLLVLQEIEEKSRQISSQDFGPFYRPVPPLPDVL